jgi:hypothetical protein
MHKAIHYSTVCNRIRQEAAQHPSTGKGWKSHDEKESSCILTQIQMQGTEQLTPGGSFLLHLIFCSSVTLKMAWAHLDPILSWDLKTMTFWLFRISQTRSNTILQIRTVYCRMVFKFGWNLRWRAMHTVCYIHIRKKRNMSGRVAQVVENSSAKPWVQPAVQGKICMYACLFVYISLFN